MEAETKIYILKTRDDDPIVPSFLKLLSDYELEKYKKYLHKNDAVNYLYAHALLKILLSKIKKCSTNNLIFFVNKYGKPYVTGGPYFSISHTIGMIGIAISNIEIGLDIENINRKINWNEFDLIWSRSEKKYLGSIKYNNKIFYNIFTFKEAIVKALGLGLNMPFNQIILPLKSLNKKTKILALVATSKKFIRCYNLNLVGYSSSIAGNNIKDFAIQQIKIKDYL